MLAPEHDVPTIYEDCWTALQRVAAHASEKFTNANKDPWLKKYADFSRLSIIGDSAGGNIVYHMTMIAGRDGGINENVAINGSIHAFPYLLIPIENAEQIVSYKIWTAIAPPSEAGFHSTILIHLLKRLIGMKKSGWKEEIEFIEFKGEGHCFQMENSEEEKAQDLIKRFASFIQT
ncbi:hypothetical protein RND71_024596 [Anisodus tanguticus]|uniref:Alpha/beta hydrolase fold-3 domain-containing protein n=1 Tax=Anisodus tanguticus TaxID=243964 RepID=A0AAE1RNM1_9SOLA|nr:hypothetical protein RND71_024596 [Anisodus tanguticus]